MRIASPPAMGLVLSLTASLVIWVVLWALGAKALDGMLIVVGIMIVAATVQIVWPHLPGNRTD